MMTVLHLVAVLLGGVFLLCAALWLVVPAVYGLPWIPTREARIRRALQLAELRPDDLLYDLGSGDGRVLRMAAGEFGARAVGIEVGPMQCLVSWVWNWFSGNKHRVRSRCGNFYRADFRDADVVFVYLTSTQTARLQPLLEEQLRPGTRVVSIAADFQHWQPISIDREALVFVYRM